MDKKSIIGFVLMGLILFGYSWFQGEQDKKAREAYMAAQREQFVADSIDRAEHPEKYLHELVEQKSSEQHSEAIAAYQQQAQQRFESELARNFGEELVSAMNGEEQFYTIENEVLKMTISSFGGKVSDVELKDYRKYSDVEGAGELVRMFDPKSAKFDVGFYMRRGYNESKLNTEGFYFTSNGVESVTLADGVQAQRLTMRLAMDSSAALEFIYTMRPNDYMVDFDVKFVDMQDWMRNATSFDVTWNNTSYQNERGYKNENMYTTISYLFPEERKVEKLPFAEVDKRGGSRSEKIATEFEWFAFQQQFFSSIMIAPDGFSNGEVGFNTYKPGTGYIKDFKASVSVPYDVAKNTYNFKFYYGPNKYSLLKEYDLGLEKIVQLGGRLVSWVNRWIVIPVFDLLSRFIGNYGLIILILTLFIKLLIFPLTYKSMISSAQMRAIRPEIAAIQAKFPKAQTDQNEMMKSQQATMELYKKYGVSPMGGCLPMLIQFPVLIAMFRFFPTAIELRGENFLWMKDLSTYDSVLNLPFNIPWYGDHVSLMALIMAVTLFFYTKLTYKEQEQQNAPGMAGMKFMMLYFTPIMMLMWMNNYASGLCYYYFVSQMVTIIINFAFRYGINDDKLRAKMLAKAKANAAAPKKKSKWQQRLEEAQRQQEAMMKERERRQYRSKH